eukprot:NODE_6755_length_1642_cov_2.319472.p1 GENE.NODE_6755_length_1642_cov_2.319472~~NODE_6755_length_1642_cov_2.319472.p1  ORF type:complete len:394 (+),score=64.00 NODE_6755_length_1642_cov_2.319472:3-1184(+)
MGHKLHDTLSCSKVGSSQAIDITLSTPRGDDCHMSDAFSHGSLANSTRGPATLGLEEILPLSARPSQKFAASSGKADAGGAPKLQEILAVAIAETCSDEAMPPILNSATVDGNGARCPAVVGGGAHAGAPSAAQQPPGVLSGASASLGSPSLTPCPSPLAEVHARMVGARPAAQQSTAVPLPPNERFSNVDCGDCTAGHTFTSSGLATTAATRATNNPPTAAPAEMMQIRDTRCRPEPLNCLEPPGMAEKPSERRSFRASPMRRRTISGSSNDYLHTAGTPGAASAATSWLTQGSLGVSEASSDLTEEIAWEASSPENTPKRRSISQQKEAAPRSEESSVGTCSTPDADVRSLRSASLFRNDGAWIDHAEEYDVDVLNMGDGRPPKARCCTLM